MLPVILACRKICMAYSESYDLVVAGDMIGNLFSWRVGEVGAANTDEGDFPPHHALGSPSKATRYSKTACPLCCMSVFGMEQLIRFCFVAPFLNVLIVFFPGLSSASEVVLGFSSYVVLPTKADNAASLSTTLQTCT